MSASPFSALPLFGFDFIMADPPWAFENWSDKGHGKAPQGQYDCMAAGAIAALPVGDLARGDCVLWLWATHPMLPQALNVMERWGFRFATSGVWVKRTATGKLAFGTGYRLRCASEPFLIGIAGAPRTERTVRTVIEGPLREHSRKPDEAYAEAEKMMPGAFRRLDLFSRQSRPGWTAWGDEAGKFDQQTEQKEKAA